MKRKFEKKVWPCTKVGVIYTLPYVIASTGGYQPLPRHLGGTNVCFVDGHSKWFKVPGVLNTADEAMWDVN